MERICSRCGHDLRRPHDLMTYWRTHMSPLRWLACVLDQYDDHDNELGMTVEFIGAYGSTLDLTRWSADLCEQCSLDLRSWIEAGR